MVRLKKIAVVILLLMIFLQTSIGVSAIEPISGGSKYIESSERILSEEEYDAQLITSNITYNVKITGTAYGGGSIFKFKLTTRSSIEVVLSDYNNTYNTHYDLYKDSLDNQVADTLDNAAEGIYYIRAYPNDSKAEDIGQLNINAPGLDNNPEIYNIKTTYDGFNEGDATNSGYIKIMGEYNDSQGVTIDPISIGGVTKGAIDIPAGRGEWELSWDISEFSDGVYIEENIEVVASNSSGGSTNTTIDIIDFKVDTTGPQAPRILGLSDDTDSGIKGDGITGDERFGIEIEVLDGSEYNLYRNGNLVYMTGNRPIEEEKSIYIVSNEVEEGKYTYEAVAYDDLGNMSNKSDSFMVEVDTTPPSSPVITRLSDGNNDVFDGDATKSDEITVYGSTSGASINLYNYDDLLAENIDVDSNEWNYQLNSLIEGAYSLKSKAVDVAGNLSDNSNTFTFIIDQTPPIINIDGIQEVDDTGEIGDNKTRSTDVTITGSVSDSIDETIETVDVYLDDAFRESTSVNSEGEWAYTINNLVPGDLTFTIKATDDAKNLASKDYTFTVTTLENNPIQTPSIKGIRKNDDTGLIGDGETRAKYISFEGFAEPNSTVNLSVEQTISLTEEETVEERSINMLSMTRSGPYPENITAHRTSSAGDWTTDSKYFEPGEYIITANSEDAAGNISETSETYSLLIDPNPMQSPVVIGIDEDTGYSDSDYVTNDQTLEIIGTAEINSTIELLISQTHPDDIIEVNMLGMAEQVITDINGEWLYPSDSPLEEGIYYVVPTSHSIKSRSSKKADKPYQTVEIDLTPPEITTEPAIVINEGSTETYNPEVSLEFYVSDANEVIISNLSDLSDSEYGLYSNNMWHEINTDSFGEKNIYVKFRDLAGNETGIFSSKIELLPTNLTIKYQYGNGDKAVDEYKEELVFNTNYNVESPDIKGYVPDMQKVSGDMDEVNKEIIVTYDKADYQVIFETNGGSNLDSQGALYQGKISKPVDPIKNDYIFDGWYKESSLESMWDFEVDSVTSDMTLYAKWLEDNSSADTSSSRRRQRDLAETSANNKEFTSSVKKERVNGSDIITVNIDPLKIAEVISNQTSDQEKDLQVNVKDKFTETAKVRFDGKTVKDLEDNDYTIKIEKNNVKYNLPAKELNIEKIAKELNIDRSLMDEIEVSIEVSEVKGDVLNRYKEMVENNNSELIIEPISFNIVAKKKGQENEDEIKVHRFKRYVERVIEIPSNLDPKTITTGVVFNEDGSYSHVPTEVFERDGKYYARINSLTNSDYSLISNKVELPNIKGHWAENTINDLGNRMIIVDISNFNPDSEITRGEFAEYITRALGIHRKGVANSSLFTDVSQGHPLADAITLAYDYNIISGYPNGYFKTEKTITRQEAMSMYARAIRAISFEDIQGSRIEEYEDKEEVAEWAYADVSKVLNAKVFNGRSMFRIAPNDTFTYAEAASAIKNLLVKANLINE